MKKYTLFICFLLTNLFLCTAQRNLRLWYDHPAKNWLASLPLGNGRLGAMPDGGVLHENIILNDITLWSGSPQDANRKGAANHLDEIRQLIFAGKNAEAEALVNKYFVCRGAGSGHGHGANVPYGSYQVLGNLQISYQYSTDSNNVSPQHYIWQLAIDSALAKCSYSINGTTYKRAYFASFSDDVVIIKITADKPGKINFTLSLDRPERYTTAVEGEELKMYGRLNDGIPSVNKGMRYLTRVRIKHEGGKLISLDSALQIKKANTAIIYISSATDFRHFPFK